MLNLVGQLLAHGRLLERLGVTQEAFLLFNRLARLRHLPPEAAREVQERLTRIHLKRRQFSRARRRLTALLSGQPSNARYHYQMARAVAADPRADRGRALEHCRRAVTLAPEHAGYLSTLGLLALRDGRDEEGLSCLRRARRVAPDEPRVVRRLAKGLCRLGRADEARAVLLAARFRNRRDGRFQRLWRDFQFQQLRRNQEEQRRARGAGITTDAPPLLPFVRLLATRTPHGDDTVIRADAPAVLPAPHLPRPLRRPDQRHAQ
jgi:tetratricopeptide (TPR) repeat protein